MNEQRPWWKLSWPAVVAGLVMLGALAVKNLDGTAWTTAEKLLPFTLFFHSNPAWTSNQPTNASMTFTENLENGFGWPMMACRQPVISRQDPKALVTPGSLPVPTDTPWPNLSTISISSVPCLIVDIVVGVLVTLGTVQVINRWQRQEVFHCTVSLKGMLAFVGLVAINITLFTRSHDPLWTIKPIATGVLFVGIFLTCLAVIDWIGWGWGLVTRRRDS